MIEKPNDPNTLRTYASLFDAMLPRSDATSAAAAALRWQADEIERRRGGERTRNFAASASGQVGQSVIYWSADGTALYKTPSGTIMHGTWQVKDNTNCAVWKERPNTACVRYDKVGDVVTVIDAASGQVRAKILKTASGNAEKLTP